MKKKLCFVLNIAIIILAVIGNILTFTSTESATGLVSTGVENFKYFTILSNEFCAIIALCNIIFTTKGLTFPIKYKLVSTAAVGLTFITIAAFLGPVYGHAILYQNANLYFHLIIPLLAMLEFILTDADKTTLPFRSTFLSVIPVILYGTGYLINIAINGKGTWPNTNDWYGFLNWGTPAAILICVSIISITWIISCLLRITNIKLNLIAK